MSSMRTSGAGIKLIEHEEGTILHVYKDSVGIPTVGTGHKVLPSDHFTSTSTITQSQADHLLQNDLRGAEYAVNSCITVPLTANQFDALVCLTFNIGSGGFHGSSLVKVINSQQAPDAIKAHWLLWNKAGGQYNEELHQRRIREFNRYMTK